MEAEVNLGRQIHEIRKEKGWRQEDLAAKSGLSLDYIGKLERGERTPSLKVLISLLNLMQASPEDILDDYMIDGYGYRIRSYARRIKKLPAVEREKIYMIIDELTKQKQQ